MQMKQKSDKKVEEVKANKEVAFIIEGHRSFEKKTSNQHRFPEISAAIQLAKINDYEYFDPISSYDEESIAELLKDAKDEQRQTIVLIILTDFATEADPSDIIKKLIKPPFEALVKRGVLTKIPEWLQELTADKIPNLSQRVLSQYTKSSAIEDFKREAKQIHANLDRISKIISQKRLVSYLDSHPRVVSIYGLIGRDHLNEFDAVGDVISKNGDYANVRIKHDSKTINLYLFGGEHRKIKYYEAMAKLASAHGLRIPEVVLPKAPKLDLLAIFEALGITKASSSTSSTKDSSESKAHQEQHEHKESREKTIEELVENFDWWMKNTSPHSSNHGNELVLWLSEERGGLYIKTYSRFLELARALNSKGYNLTSPPNEQDFNKGMEEYNHHLEERCRPFSS